MDYINSENRNLIIVTNNEMLNYVNDNSENILLEKHSIITTKDFKEKINKDLSVHTIYGSMNSYLFNILDNPKIDWTIISKLKKDEYDTINEYIKFFNITNHQIEKLI